MPNKEQEYREEIKAVLESYQEGSTKLIHAIDEITRLSASHFATPQMEVDLGKVFDENCKSIVRLSGLDDFVICREEFIEAVQPLLSASTQIELSDEEIRAEALHPHWTGMASAFCEGAKWYRSELARRGEGKKEVI